MFADNKQSIAEPKIIVALDFADEQSALVLLHQLDPAICRVKIGKELFVSCGPQLVEKIQTKGFEVFLDLKFHDIPNTVSRACQAAARLGVWMVNVHASGGLAMMTAARDALQNFTNPPLLIAVTVLTSLDNMALAQIGFKEQADSQVLHLAQLAYQAELDGVVCSAREAALIRNNTDKDFCLVTPGIRPVNVDTQDQSRVCTPRQALDNGADYLVIGRPITEANNPRHALQTIYNSL